MRKFLFLSIFTFAITIGGIIILSQGQNDVEQAQVIVQHEQFSEGGPEIDFHPVSLPALIEQEYDGRDLQLGKVLEENSAYTRYYITYKSGELTISGIMNVPKGPGTFSFISVEPWLY